MKKSLIFSVILLCIQFSFSQEVAEDIYQQGLDSYNSKNFAAASGYFDEYIKMCPDSAKGYYSKGEVLLMTKEFENALDAFSEAILIYVLLNQSNNAFRDFRKALEIDPNDMITYNAMGIAYSQVGKMDDAISTLNTAISIDPSYSESYRNRGLLYFYKGDTLKALTDLNKAIELNPSSVVLYNTRGGLYNVMGEYANALDDFDRALGIDRNNGEAYCRKGVAYLNLGIYDKAIEYMEKGVKLDPAMEDNIKDYLKEAKKKLSKKNK